nr:aminotransferase class I/II-fold pyridoxal phosphate-dependent enzyme [Anaerofustis sp. HA2171]
MYSFTNDYSEGAHKNILAALIKTNFEQTSGYGTDKYCEEASEIIKKLINREDSNVHFLSGGTVTNTAFISSALRPHEGVIAASTAHINVHESGAIEARGHKIIVKEENNGKLLASDVEEVAKKHFDDEEREHCVKPKMVYISNPTELGTIYTKEEIKKLREVCDNYGLYLYLDGARLGSALTCVDNDVTLEDIASLTDAFYIGGTKMGALFGEALVINNEELNVDFRYHLKQNGGMIAKGRLLGVQFVELFKDGLYFEIGKHENRLANKLTLGIGNLGYGFYSMSATNQVFPILPNDILKVLLKKYSFELWEKLSEEKSVIRLCTSFATTEKAVDEFLKDLAKLTIAKEKLMKELNEEHEDAGIEETVNVTEDVPVEEVEEVVEEDFPNDEAEEIEPVAQDVEEIIPEEVTEEEEIEEFQEDEVVEPVEIEEDDFVEDSNIIDEHNDVTSEEENLTEENYFEDNSIDENLFSEPAKEEVVQNEYVEEDIKEEDIEPQKSERVESKKLDFETFEPMEEKIEPAKTQSKDIFEDIFSSEIDYTNFDEKDSKEDDKVIFKKDSDIDFFSEFEFED